MYTVVFSLNINNLVNLQIFIDPIVEFISFYFQFCDPFVFPQSQLRLSGVRLDLRFRVISRPLAGVIYIHEKSPVTHRSVLIKYQKYYS